MSSQDGPVRLPVSMTATNTVLTGGNDNIPMVNQNPNEYLAQWQAAVSALYKSQPNSFYSAITSPAMTAAAQNMWVANSQAQLAALANDPALLQQMQGQNMQNAFGTYGTQLPNVNGQADASKLETKIEKTSMDHRGFAIKSDVSKIASMDMKKEETDAGIALDEREVKKLRRKQSNRESARRSRLRKQAECEELGVKVQRLSNDNEQLQNELFQMRQKCDTLTSENNQLQRQLHSYAANLRDINAPNKDKDENETQDNDAEENLSKEKV